MLVAYCDESHGAHIWSLSGFVAGDDAWKAPFTPSWRGALHDSKIKEFRAAQCDTGNGAFRGLARSDRATIQERFCGALGSIRPRGFVTAINLRHHSALRKRLDLG